MIFLLLGYFESRQCSDCFGKRRQREYPWITGFCGETPDHIYRSATLREVFHFADRTGGTLIEVRPDGRTRYPLDLLKICLDVEHLGGCR